MAKYVSSKAPVSVASLKRKQAGSVVIRHGGREDVRFTRMSGGWKRERVDVASETPSIVSSADVANECNSAIGCRESWARVY